MPKMWLCAVFEVKEENLPNGNTYTELPDTVDAAISKSKVGDALSAEIFYLLDEKNLPMVKRVLDFKSIDYHHYAVTIRGEQCLQEDCDHFHAPKLFEQDDNKGRDKTPPGFN